jgi:hypothetical protein
MGDDLRTCPYCGTAVRDAFCSDCHGELDPESLAAAEMTRAQTADGTIGPPSQADIRFLFPLNDIGFGVLALSFIPAVIVCELLRDDRDGMKLVIGGPLTAAIDLGYRLRTQAGSVLLPERGGKFFWLPIWVFGFLWTLYGLWQLSRGPG